MAGIIITTHGLRAVYSWGASDLEFKEKVSKNHLVLWEGILWAKERGFQIFDLGGMTGSKGLDPVMENIDAFKAGFGGQVQQVVRVHNLVLQKSKESVLRLVRT
jgi:lipid II:glycine glycyltransferase (peptidoglycan interpeptide bridge formation enzyme)